METKAQKEFKDRIKKIPKRDLNKAMLGLREHYGEPIGVTMFFFEDGRFKFQTIDPVLFFPEIKEPKEKYPDDKSHIG